MTKNAFIPNFLKFYNMLWNTALPFLKKNRRLKKGFTQRCSSNHIQSCDIWIQAASAGEAFLASKILKDLRPSKKTRILVTTTTQQGMDIILKEKESINPETNLYVEWFPFDIPKNMERIVKKVSPKVMVLLETEIWPALLFYLKKNRTRILILNARLSNASFKGYFNTRFIWRQIQPDTILATSREDAQRYQKLFDKASVKTAPNIKYDSLNLDTGDPGKLKSINLVMDNKTPFLVLASIRKEEERDVINIIQYLTKEYPAQTIALFPRHMHRLSAWASYLDELSINWSYKSKIKDNQIAFKVILWDTFGELNKAYRLATTAFVGGSLKPLGGQNFLEPLIHGVPTVTGPYLENFKWVDKNIFKKGIATKAYNWEMVAKALVANLRTPYDRKRKKEQALHFIKSNQGGTKICCEKIQTALKSSA